jgi:hypothetical protein
MLSAITCMICMQGRNDYREVGSPSNDGAEADISDSAASPTGAHFGSRTQPERLWLPASNISGCRRTVAAGTCGQSLLVPSKRYSPLPEYLPITAVSPGHKLSAHTTRVYSFGHHRDIYPPALVALSPEGSSLPDES